MKNNIRDIFIKLEDGKEVTEDELLLKLSNGNTIFEYAIKQGRKINCHKFSNTKSLDIILKTKKYDFLNKFDLKTLLKLNRKKLSETYMETILKLFKDGQKINISINPLQEDNSLSDVAKVYIIYAKYGLVEYLPYLDKDILLSKKMENQKENLTSIIENIPLRKDNRLTLIELLLNQSKSLTIDKIVNESIKSDFDIGMILRSYDIFENDMEYDLKSDNYISGLLNEINKKYDNIHLNNEEELLLYNLFLTFYDCSDLKALKALINSYKIQLRKGNPNTIKEIKLLIELKRSGSPLSFKIGANQYSIINKTVEIKDEFTSVMNHELGHALFHNLTDESIPQEFYDIIERIRSDKRTLKRVYEYSENEKINGKKINEWVNKKYNNAYPMINKLIELYKIRNTLKKRRNDNLIKKEEELSKFTHDLRREIYDYLIQTKEEKMRIYKEQGYAEGFLNILFDNSFTVKEYVRMHKKIQKREFALMLYSTFLSPVQSIGDIIDAIFEGKFISRNLYYGGIQIEPISGHGLFYYNSDKRLIFDEILAGYRNIMMSEYSDKYLTELRYYVGDELVNFLDNYYNNVLLNSRAWEEKNNLNVERKKKL